MTRACKGCWFWQELGETPDGLLMGECRFNPPRPITLTHEDTKKPGTEDEGLAFYPVWPLTEADEWCGAYATADWSRAGMMFMGSGGKVN